jgi:hypothetical protein
VKAEECSKQALGGGRDTRRYLYLTYGTNRFSRPR